MQIRLINVSKSFYLDDKYIEVLKNINIEIEKGKIIAIVGPSGCGKSTILNLISGLIKPDSGTVKVDGKIGYMFQKDNLLEWRNVYKNITIGCEIKHIKPDKEMIEDTLKKYGLYEFKDNYPHELSGGMRQRVALIRTLILNPDILLLDEPFSSLDYQSKIVVQQDIYKIIKDYKKTTILVTHDITEAIAMADEIYVLSNRPAIVKYKNIIDLNLPGDKKDPLSARSAPSFQNYFKKIWEQLDYK